jgi:hypothetical protein
MSAPPPKIRQREKERMGRERSLMITGNNTNGIGEALQDRSITDQSAGDPGRSFARLQVVS